MRTLRILLALLLAGLASEVQAQDPPTNLNATVSGNSVQLSWTAPGGGTPSDRGEGTLGTDGGRVRTPSGTIEVVIPPGGLEADTRVRVTSIELNDFEEEVRSRVPDPVGIPIARAAVIEIETNRLKLPAQVEVSAPSDLTQNDKTVFAQLLPDKLRFWGEGTLSEDGTKLSAIMPINANAGLPKSGSGKHDPSKTAQFFREVQGNGVDDDGDGLIDEMELYFYPDRVTFEPCIVTGSVLYLDGAPAVGADVRITSGNGLPVVSVTDAFGNYALPINAPTAPGTAAYTVTATDADGLQGSNTGTCSGNQTIATNIVINAGSGSSAVGVTITSPADNQVLNTQVTNIVGTVDDPTVEQVEILVSGQYPAITGTVNNGNFNVAVFLPTTFNFIVVLARNADDAVGAASIIVRVGEGAEEPPDLQIALQWDKNNDMDLYLVTPNDNVIYFSNRNADGGTLNIDQTSGTASGPEVISFPAGTAQPGRYGIAVQFFNDRDLGNTKATLSIFARGRTLGTFTQTLSESQSIFGASSLADLPPATVWNVRSIDMPAGSLAPTRPLSEFDLSGTAHAKTWPGKDPGPPLPPVSLDPPAPVYLNGLDRGRAVDLARFAPVRKAETILVDEVEPNNTVAEAQTIPGPSPATLNGNAESNDAGALNINFSDGTQDDLEDLFLVTTTAPGLRLDLGNFTSDLDLYLISADGSALIDGGQSNTAGATAPEQVDLPSLAAGTYLVGVSIFDADPGGGPTTSYALTVTGALEGSGGGGDVQSYRVYRSTSPNARQTGTVVANVNAASTSFVDSGVAPGRYFYQVTAVYTSGESSPSNEAVADVSGGTLNPPLAPTASSTQGIGQEFTVDLNVGSASDPVSNLFGVSFVLNYDRTDILDVVSPTSSNVTAGPFFGSNPVFLPTIDDRAGTVSIGVSRRAGEGGVNGNGTVARVRFVSSANTPEGTQVTLTLTDLTALDPSGAAVALSAVPLTITLGSSGLTVWPGDTNDDRLVNQADVLPIGLCFNQSGPARANATTAWTPQPAQPWSQQNCTFADANGNGTVNQADVLPIGLNWGQSHNTAFDGNQPVTKTTGSVRLRLEPLGRTPQGSFRVAVRADSAKALFGVSFVLHAAPALEVTAAMPGPLLGEETVYLAHQNAFAATRKAGQQAVSEPGIVALFDLQGADGMLPGATATLRLEDILAVDAAGRTLAASAETILTNLAGAETEAPLTYGLSVSYPNPFTQETVIGYALAERSDVRLTVYNLLGQPVRVLIEAEQGVGAHQVRWDGRLENGGYAPSGVYVYRLEAGPFVAGRTMTLVR